MLSPTPIVLRPITVLIEQSQSEQRFLTQSDPEIRFFHFGTHFQFTDVMFMAIKTQNRHKLEKQ